MKDLQSRAEPDRKQTAEMELPPDHSTAAGEISEGVCAEVWGR
jgi:hypothetical protein